MWGVICYVGIGLGLVWLDRIRQRRHWPACGNVTRERAGVDLLRLCAIGGQADWRPDHELERPMQ
jgi:hypothetical protein